MMKDDLPSRIRSMRMDYDRFALLESQAPEDPFRLFEQWFEQAISHSTPEPNAMALSTCDEHGRPSCRMVLLKDFSSAGFTFFTNYESRKGQELNANPQASLLFFWHAMQRQVEIQGRVHKISKEASDAYFQSRVLDARLGAWASTQSAVVKDRKDLEDRFVQARQRFSGKEISRPEYWGGYCVVPDVFLFWQGRPNRMHDRLRYRRKADAWLRERISP